MLSVFPPGVLIDDRFEVLAPLGEGAVGVVLHVADRNLNGAEVALKILDKKRLDADQGANDRLINEVVLARSLSHPNIVRIHDLVHSTSNPGLSYIAMEYVDGGDLRDKLAKENPQGMPVEQAVTVLYQVLLGVHCAHRQGIVHRDIKLSNVLVDSNECVKVGDFGLARSLDLELGLTKTGETVGSPKYMAPEQFRGSTVDQRADIYSIGLLAYHLVCGKPPFTDPNYLRLAQQHFSSPMPRIIDQRPEVPAWYADAAVVAAAKTRDARFQSLQEYIEILLRHVPELADAAPVGRASPADLGTKEAAKELKRVLVVEDDAIYSKVLRRTFARLGSCDAIDDGFKAVEQFKNALENGQPYDLITLDIGLPGISGLAVLATIRELERDRGIAMSDRTKVIMLTSEDGEEKIDAAYSYGCASYFEKPVKQELLVQELRELGFAVSEDF